VGALLLELGRTTLSLRMGQSPVSLLRLWVKHIQTDLELLMSVGLYDERSLIVFVCWNCPVQGEAVVNAGPAIFISPAGPNPIMVQVSRIPCLRRFYANSSCTMDIVLSPVPYSALMCFHGD
jgi:hypothetical protein